MRRTSMEVHSRAMVVQKAVRKGRMVGRGRMEGRSARVVVRFCWGMGRSESQMPGSCDV